MKSARLNVRRYGGLCDDVLTCCINVACAADIFREYPYLEVDFIFFKKLFGHAVFRKVFAATLIFRKEIQRTRRWVL